MTTDLRIPTKNLEKYRIALDQFAIVAITDVEGTITYVNEKFCEISKYSRDELIGQNHRILKSGFHSPEFYKNLWKTITGGNVWQDDIKNMAKDGSIYWVKTTITPFKDKSGKINEFVSIRVDITRQKQLTEELLGLEKQLKEQNENLEDEVKRKSEKLVKSEKFATIGELGARIAHDFRNPLGAIKSSSVIIDKENKHNNKVMDRELNRIKLSIKRMTHQVEDVLNYVRATPLSVSESTINEILNDSLVSIDVPDNVKINLPKNDVEIECDLDKLAIVLTNIILNAIQAIDDKDGTINIRVNEYDNSVKIEVENSGPNIPDEILTEIFEPLYTTRFKGTGLGLSSCKNMIEQHKGTISAKSNPVVFTIQIPKKQ